MTIKTELEEFFASIALNMAQEESIKALKIDQGLMSYIDGYAEHEKTHQKAKVKAWMHTSRMTDGFHIRFIIDDPSTPITRKVARMMFNDGQTDFEYFVDLQGEVHLLGDDEVETSPQRAKFEDPNRVRLSEKSLISFIQKVFSKPENHQINELKFIEEKMTVGVQNINICVMLEPSVDAERVMFTVFTDLTKEEVLEMTTAKGFFLDWAGYYDLTTQKGKILVSAPMTEFTVNQTN